MATISRPAAFRSFGIRLVTGQGKSRSKMVQRLAPVLNKRADKKHRYVFVRDATGRRSEMGWKDFQILLGQVGCKRKLTGKSEVIIESEMADTIHERWKAFRKPKKK